MKLKSYIMDESAVNRALKRISFEIAERNKGFGGVCFVGVERRGVPLAKKIASFIKSNENIDIPVGSVDIAGYRDDLSVRKISRECFESENNLDFDVNGKNVVIVDDVICTGRTVRAAMEAVLSFGRPKTIQLAVLVDRGHRELPIRPEFIGKNIPTSSQETVVVSVPEYDGETSVAIYEK